MTKILIIKRYKINLIEFNQYYIIIKISTKSKKHYYLAINLKDITNNNNNIINIMKNIIEYLDVIRIKLKIVIKQIEQY